MNYLAEIKKLKQQEEEKKARLSKIKEDKEKNGREYLSNLTFMNFEKYILNYISYFIEEEIKKAIKNEKFDNEVKIYFNISDVAFESNLVDGCKILGKVQKDEFLKYIRSMPGYLDSSEAYGAYIETFDLETLAEFYFEKLQELEYYNIDYSSKSR